MVEKSTHGNGDIRPPDRTFVQSTLLMHRPFAFTLFALSTVALMAQPANAGPDAILCVNSYTMQATSPPPGGFGSWTIVSGCGTISDPSSPSTLVTNLCPGITVFQWTEDDNGFISTDQMIIEVWEGYPPQPAGQDITVVLPNTSAQLSATAPVFPQTCWWTVVQGSASIADASDPNTMVAGLSVGQNIFAWNCDNGPCGTLSDQIVVDVLDTPSGLSAPSVHASPWMAFDAAHGELRLLTTARVENLTIVDAQGRMVRTDRSTRTWQMADGLPGVYIVRAMVGGRPRMARFATFAP